MYLVATRVWAALITMIPLYLAALFASYLASELVVTKFFGLSTGTYTHYFRLYLPPLDIFYSFLKAMVFAVLVTFVHCYYGYNVTGSGRRRCRGRPGHPPLHHPRRRRESLHVTDPVRRGQRHGEVGRMKRSCASSSVWSSSSAWSSARSRSSDLPTVTLRGTTC